MKRKQTQPSSAKPPHPANELEQLYATAASAGIKILSDAYCCRLLAWLLVYGGGEEATVMNTRLTTDIREAQKRLNIYGGERPNSELLPELQSCIAECGGERGRVYPHWVEEIEKNYKLTRRGG